MQRRLCKRNPARPLLRTFRTGFLQSYTRQRLSQISQSALVCARFAWNGLRQCGRQRIGEGRSWCTQKTHSDVKTGRGFFPSPPSPPPTFHFPLPLLSFDFSLLPPSGQTRDARRKNSNKGHVGGRLNLGRRRLAHQIKKANPAALAVRSATQPKCYLFCIWHRSRLRDAAEIGSFE